MKKRTFMILLFFTLGVCLLLTVVHFLYAIHAYQNASIIQFIAEEIW